MIYLHQEIDWIEERGGQLYGYEMKWSKPNAKAPNGWTNAYPDTHFEVVHPGNFREFVIKDDDSAAI